VSSTLLRLRDELRSELASCHPDSYLADDAATVTEVLAEIVRLGNAAKLRFARRAAKGKVHEASGHRNAGEWLAEITGDSVARANSELETAKAVEAHPELKESFDSGRISLQRAREAALAADATAGSG
jgi:hypothetical protein